MLVLCQQLLHADWPLAADVALVGGRVLSPGSERYGTPVNVDAVALAARDLTKD